MSCNVFNTNIQCLKNQNSMFYHQESMLSLPNLNAVITKSQCFSMPRFITFIAQYQYFQCQNSVIYHRNSMFSVSNLNTKSHCYSILLSMPKINILNAQNQCFKCSNSKFFNTKTHSCYGQKLMFSMPTINVFNT